MRCANDGIGFEKVISGEFLSSSHINKMHLTVGINHRILRFEVSVNNAIGV